MQLTREELLEILKNNTPDPKKPIKELRDDFHNFYLKFQNIRTTPTKVMVDDLVCYWVIEKNVTKPYVILFMHGGGFTMGSTGDHLGLCEKISKYSSAKVFSVDYHLAPEYVYPKALNDCVRAYQYLLKSGYLPSQIIPVGISAGGTLVLSLLLSLRKQNEVLPSIACCMSPAVDLLFKGESVFENQDRDWITKARLDSIKNIYLKNENPKNPLVSPFYADLSKLPEIYLQFGSFELLRDDILAFVHKATEQGTIIKYDMFQKMFHCWQIFSDVLTDAEKAVLALGNYINTKFSDNMF